MRARHDTRRYPSPDPLCACRRHRLQLGKDITIGGPNVVSQDAVIRRNPRVEFREMGEGGGVLLHVGSGAYHGVNEIGALIWGLLADGMTTRVIVEELRTRVEDPPEDLEAEVSTFVDELMERDLLEVGDPPQG